MSEEFINYSYIEMLIQDLEENSLGYWNATQDEMAKSLRNLQQENQQLKDRINKAIEYIEKHKQVYDIDGSVEPKLDDFDILASPKYLLDLLKGDKE